MFPASANSISDGGEVAIHGLVGVDPGDAVVVDDDDPRSCTVPVLVGRCGVERTVTFEVVFVQVASTLAFVLDVGGDPLALTSGVEDGQRYFQQHQNQGGDDAVADQ